MQPDFVTIDRRPRILALVRTETLLGQIRTYLGHHQLASCSTAMAAQLLFAELSPAIIIFETGVWARAESSRLIALLARACESTVFVFWREGSAALAELSAVARGATNVHAIHENYSLTPLDDACIERSRSTSVLERVRNKLADTGRIHDFSRCLIAALSLASQPCSVGQLATAIGIGQTNLRVRCRGVGLPTPVDLLGWARALHIVDHLAEQSGLDAGELGIANKTGKNCSEYVRYHTGKGPHSWLASGGFDGLLEAFVLALPYSDGVGPDRPRA